MSAMELLREFIEAEVAADRLPGAVVGIVHRGEVVFLEAWGYRDKARGVPMTTDALFWIASMSKPITAAGALLLVERGRLVLDEPIGTYLPQFAGRPVEPTVLDLLRHTAGMPEGLLGDSPVHKLYAEAVGDGMTDLTGAEFIGRLSELPLLHEPGAMWHYGWGLDLTGLIIESVVGTPLGSSSGTRSARRWGCRTPPSAFRRSIGTGSPARCRSRCCPTSRSRGSTPAGQDW